MHDHDTAIPIALATAAAVYWCWRRDRKSSNSISKRGERALAPAIDYLPLFFAALQDPWDADTNAHGKIPLCIAENMQAFPLLKPTLRKAAAAAIDQPGVANYGEPSHRVLCYPRHSLKRASF